MRPLKPSWTSEIARALQAHPFDLIDPPSYSQLADAAGAGLGVTFR
jgi:hypothetical protein